MVATVRDVMSLNPVAYPETSSVQQAAQAMRDQNIGSVIVLDGDGHVCGMVTDRDIVIRALADDPNLGNVTLADVCSDNPATVTPLDSLDDAKRWMEQESVRRLPVVDANNTPVGIVSLGDLAPETSVDSTMEEIVEAPPDK